MVGFLLRESVVFVFSLVQCAFWLVLYIHFVYFVASFLALFNIVAFVAYIYKYIYFICLILSNWKVMIL